MNVRTELWETLWHKLLERDKTAPWDSAVFPERAFMWNAGTLGVQVGRRGGGFPSFALPIPLCLPATLRDDGASMKRELEDSAGDNLTSTRSPRPLST